ncbi:MAG: serine/threonine protein kinase [Myxococcales bacterium]|nr:serine/threonine protein kinase [Myxococcales bacterium]
MIGAGQLIGNYRIVSKLGTGGMGAVFLAEHPMIGKKVALKVIHRELATNKEVVQRFFQEARAVNRIGNEHIVEIHDFGVTPEGDHFYIMEYLEGRTLASVLARETALETMRALHVGAQIASALSAAHNSGVIHRDLKPDNIMLMTRLGDPDFVKVLDFGLAKMFQGSGASAVQTAAGVLLGTPQYMSPEACESKRDIDHRTDIYALGILLFQMMTGVLPFDGETMGEVLVKQVTALPPVPRGLNSMIPPSVEQILLRCLAKHPDARFQTMQALREALLDPEAYLHGSPPIAPARSVAPGEAVADARAVQAHANAKTRMLQADQQQLAAAGGPSAVHAATIIGAPIPVTSKSRQIPVPGLVPPQEVKHNTMRISTPMGYSSRPPRRVWPIVLVVGLLVGLGGGAFAVAWYRRSQTGGGETVASGSGSAGSAGSGAQSLSDAMNGSDRSAGSAGSAGSATKASAVDAAVDAPPAVDAATSVSASADAALPTDAPAPADATSAQLSVDAAVVAPPVDAGAPGVPTGKLARLTLDSSPVGASVFGPDGTLLGKTPIKVDWAVSAKAVVFELKLKGYRDKKTEITVTSNTMTRVELERIPVIRPGGGSGRGSGKGSGDGNGLIRPDDL